MDQNTFYTLKRIMNELDCDRDTAELFLELGVERMRLVQTLQGIADLEEDVRDVPTADNSRAVEMALNMLDNIEAPGEKISWPGPLPSSNMKELEEISQSLQESRGEVS